MGGAFEETAPEPGMWLGLEGGLEAGKEVHRRLCSDFRTYQELGYRGPFAAFLVISACWATEPPLHGFACPRVLAHAS